MEYSQWLLRYLKPWPKEVLEYYAKHKHEITYLETTIDYNLNKRTRFFRIGKEVSEIFTDDF